LFALTTATVLASGAAFAAGMSTVPIGSHDFVNVQQNDRSEDRSANINERESGLRNRIDRGISDGRITRHEAHRLYDELSQIEAKERAARANGRIGGRESREINDDLDRLAEDVRHQIRDDQRRDDRRRY
ncbi:MAG TPA: hypothetical protein VLI21_14180, partial [Casimicrobiaceae bacterium]|nr:hypothetical protein [Casimicrobiaceae bacterium]